jgi:hypothetical protein
MRYFGQMIASADKLNLYTMWAMMAHAQEINAAHPISKDDWFLSHQVESLLDFVETAGKYLRVPSVSIDQFTVEFVLKGLNYEAMLCLADSDVTCYSWEYSSAAEFLRNKLAEKFRC